MIQITQDNATGVKIGNGEGAYTFPNGTIFKGFLRMTEESSGLLYSSIQWYINDSTVATEGLNLPYVLGAPITDGTVQVPGNRAQYNAALLINTNLVVDYISELFPTLDEKIQVIGI